MTNDDFGVYEKNLNNAGVKMDFGKVAVLTGAIQYFPRALLAVAKVSEFGAKKYTWNGWETVVNGKQRYGDALGRHLIMEQTDGLTDFDSGLYHAAHVAWNALARLELLLKEE